MQGGGRWKLQGELEMARRKEEDCREGGCARQNGREIEIDSERRRT